MISGKSHPVEALLRNWKNLHYRAYQYIIINILYKFVILRSTIKRIGSQVSPHYHRALYSMFSFLCGNVLWTTKTKPFQLFRWECFCSAVLIYLFTLVFQSINLRYVSHLRQYVVISFRPTFPVYWLELY